MPWLIRLLRSALAHHVQVLDICNGKLAICCLAAAAAHCVAAHQSLRQFVLRVLRVGSVRPAPHKTGKSTNVLRVHMASRIIC